MIHGFDDTDKSKKEVLEKSQAASKTDFNNLQDQINTHNHDSRYYTKQQTDQKIDSKDIDITGAASTIVKNNLTANKVLVSNSSGKVGASSIAASLLNYLSGLTSNIQSQLNGKANSSHTHDDRYYTESEMNTKLNGKSNTGHTHDDRYYTEAETNALIKNLNIGGVCKNQNLEVQVWGTDGRLYRLLLNSSTFAFQWLDGSTWRTIREI